MGRERDVEGKRERERERGVRERSLERDIYIYGERMGEGER